MLQLSGAGKRFGTKLLFENVNWLITPDERTALVGANGTGKSTLMKILAGNDTHEGGLDYGAMQRTKGMSIGYLPQDGLSLSGRTVFDECLTVFDELRAMETRTGRTLRRARRTRSRKSPSIRPPPTVFLRSIPASPPTTAMRSM